MAIPRSLVVFATCALLVGCSAAPSPPPTDIIPISAPGSAPTVSPTTVSTSPAVNSSPVPGSTAWFVGKWYQHGYALTINGDLTGELVGINADPTNSTPGPPDYREKASLTFIVQTSGITAHVGAVTNPNSDPNGTFYAAWYRSGDDVTVRMDDQPGVLDFGDSRYCTDAAYDTGVCGA